MIRVYFILIFNRSHPNSAVSRYDHIDFLTHFLFDVSVDQLNY